MNMYNSRGSHRLNERGKFRQIPQNVGNMVVKFTTFIESMRSTVILPRFSYEIRSVVVAGAL